MAAGSDQFGMAKQFISFATSPERLAALSEIIPYGPSRKSALFRVGLNEETGVPMRDHLPNAPHHGARYLTRDSVWNAHTQDLRFRRFNEWIGASHRDATTQEEADLQD